LPCDDGGRALDFGLGGVGMSREKSHDWSANAVQAAGSSFLEEPHSRDKSSTAAGCGMIYQGLVLLSPLRIMAQRQLGTHASYPSEGGNILLQLTVKTIALVIIDTGRLGAILM